ncbi:MAG: response regulator transcription factor [Bacteroidota bacterium]
MDTIKISLADDHLLFREGLATIISFVPHLSVIQQASDGEELIALLEEELPDVVLLDLKMPRMDGIQATEIIKERFPSVKIIILTMHHQEDFILHMLNLGVNAYLFKNASTHEVRKAIESCHTKGFYFDDTISQVMLKGLKKKHISKPQLDAQANITPREAEVLDLICREYTTPEIADKLFVSTRTVETHRKNLLTKFNAKNTAGLVIRAISLQLFDYPLVS